MSEGLNQTQKAGITEDLFALACLVESDGQLSIAKPFVDDEGVDLLVYRHKLGGKVIYLQVKSRFTLNKKGRFRSQVRRKSFRPRKDLYLAFVYYDVKTESLSDSLWLIPSCDFVKLLKGQSAKRKIYVFQSAFASKNDMWKPYRLQIQDLSSKLFELLKGRSERLPRPSVSQ